MRRKRKKQNRVLILLFCILIFGFTIATFVAPKREFSERENVALAQRPQVSAEAVFSGQFSKDYESYLTDQFVMRDAWIGLKTAVERLTGKQDINDVYFAEDDYLIEKHTNVFTAQLAQQNIMHLANFTKQMEATYGEGHVSAMIVPNAVEVLEEKLPYLAAPYDESEYLAQVKNALSPTVWFDSEAVLKEHKDKKLYYRTDHHWTTEAAFLVYESWAKAFGLNPLTENDYVKETVTEDFKGTIEAKVGGDIKGEPITIWKEKDAAKYTITYGTGENRRQSEDLYERSYLEKRDKYAVYFGGNHPVAEVDVENDSERKLLVIKDSYAHCFLPFTFHDFSEVDFVDIRYFNESLKAYMEKNEYTDVLFLYNASGFASDASLAKLNM